MTCYHPLKAYRSTEINPATGKHGLTFSATKALREGSTLALPCGRCIGCRIDRSRQWALRCMHEAQMHDRNSFITLTYDDQSVPQDYGLKLRDWQLFMKRLRKRIGTRLRFYACGEYGDHFGRPHYHALLFGYDFPDKVFQYSTRASKERVYTSELLREVWPLGDHKIGSVTFKSAAYVARYVIKKQNGDRAADHYNRVSPVDGQTYNVPPEFAVMSRRPGVGTDWFNKFKGDAFPSDFLIVDGRKIKPPKFYLSKLSENEQKPIKRTRARQQLKQKWNNTPARLAVREEIQQVRVKRLLRPLES